MMKLTISAILALGATLIMTANSEESTEIAATWDAFKSTPEYHDMKKGLLCHVSQADLDAMKEHQPKSVVALKDQFHKCRQTYPHVKTAEDKDQNDICMHICLWKGLGFFGADGKTNEEKLTAFANGLESPGAPVKQENVKYFATSFIECFQQHPQSVDELAESEKQCGKLPCPFNACLKQKLHGECEKHGKQA